MASYDLRQVKTESERTFARYEFGLLAKQIIGSEDESEVDGFVANVFRLFDANMDGLLDAFEAVDLANIRRAQTRAFRTQRRHRIAAVLADRLLRPDCG